MPEEGKVDTVTELIEEDKKKSAEIMGVLRKWLDSEAKNSAFIIRSAPRAEDAMRQFADKVYNMLNAFIVEKELPTVNTWTREQLLNSCAGFWVTRAKTIKVERERA